MHAHRVGIEHWVQRMSGQHLPAFARTAQRIASRSRDEDSATADLASLILEDVSMTTRLLRMANSAMFNPAGVRVATVSRAIVVLGFDAVRELCTSIAVIEGLIAGHHPNKVAEAMAGALHAALQARQLARSAHLGEIESIFVATLLAHLGELVLLHLAGAEQQDLVERLGAMRDLPTEEREQAEVELLGFPLRELTLRLNREWRLSELLAAALDPAGEPDARCLAVRFGCELARRLREDADPDRMDGLMETIGHAFQLPLEEVQQGALEVRQQATRTILALGARLEPVQPGPAAQAATATRWNEGQAELALGILREYAQLLCEQRPSAGALMELILEGLYRGVGLDRVGFLLLDPQRRWLHPKRVLDVTGQRELPAFAATPGQASLMAFSLARDEAIWLGDPHGPSLPPDPELGRLCGGQCLIAPLAVAGKAIGCLYADRAASGRGLDAETFGRFRLFAHQARIGLSLIRPT